jgi:hypothetical protein
VLVHRYRQELRVQLQVKAAAEEARPPRLATWLWAVVDTLRSAVAGRRARATEATA